MSEKKEQQVFDHVIIKVTNTTDEAINNVPLILSEKSKTSELKYESLTNSKYDDFLEAIQEGEYSYPHTIKKIKVEAKFLESLNEEETHAFLMYNVNKLPDDKYNFPFGMKRNPAQEQRDMIQFETIISVSTTSNIIFGSIPAKSSIIIHLYDKI